MNSNKLFRIFAGLIILALMVSSVSFPAKAQDASTDGESVQAEEAYADAPQQESFASFTEPPALTEAQLETLQWAEENTHLAPPVDSQVDAVLEGPAAGTESLAVDSRTRSGEPLAPGSAQVYTGKTYGPIPNQPGFSNLNSNVMEHSTSGIRTKFFNTGNWFAAYSVNKGANWTFLNPWSGFPDFCCDQVAIYDGARDMFIWLRMGSPNAAGQNTFKLSTNAGFPFNAGTTWTYTFAPTGTNAAWTNNWWDYPHMQLGADFLYISWNMFDATDHWVRTVVLRFPLDSLLTGAGFNYSYFADTGWFTYVPVSGSPHVMYFGSSWKIGTGQGSTFRVVRWDEDNANFLAWTVTIPAFNRAQAYCGSPSWLSRSDFRALTGSRYVINEESLDSQPQPKVPGLPVVGWWWNVAAGGGFPYPYVNAVAFWEYSLAAGSTPVIVPGLRGRPFIWMNSGCFAYPSIAANARGDLGAVVNYAVSTLNRPRVAYMLADDYIGAPAGWTYYTVKISTAGPSDGKWGDYNTVRAHQLGDTWYAAAHYIYNSTTNCFRTSTCSQPLWFAFGRVRDFWNWRR